MAVENRVADWARSTGQEAERAADLSGEGHRSNLSHPCLKGWSLLQ